MTREEISGVLTSAGHLDNTMVQVNMTGEVYAEFAEYRKKRELPQPGVAALEAYADDLRVQLEVLISYLMDGIKEVEAPVIGKDSGKSHFVVSNSAAIRQAIKTATKPFPNHP